MNWLRIIITITGGKNKSEFSALSFTTLFWAAKCDWSHMQMNGENLVMWPETDIGRELSLTSFSVTGHELPLTSFSVTGRELSLTSFTVTNAVLAAVKVYVLTTDCTPWCQRLSERERLLKAFNQNEFCHTDPDFSAHSKCKGFEQLHERGLFCIKKQFLCISATPDYQRLCVCF